MSISCSTPGKWFFPHQLLRWHAASILTWVSLPPPFFFYFWVFQRSSYIVQLATVTIWLWGRVPVNDFPWEPHDLPWNFKDGGVWAAGRYTRKGIHIWFMESTVWSLIKYSFRKSGHQVNRVSKPLYWTTYLSDFINHRETFWEDRRS